MYYIDMRMTKEWFISLITSSIIAFLFEFKFFPCNFNLLFYFLLWLFFIYYFDRILYLLKNIDHFLFDYFIILLLCILVIVLVFHSVPFLYLNLIMCKYIFYCCFFNSFVFICLWTLLVAIQLPSLSNSNKSWKKN